MSLPRALSLRGRARSFVARLLPLALVALASCSGEGPTGLPPAVATLTVTPGADTLIALGRSRTYTAVAKDANGAVVSGATWSWSSSDPLVAIVDATTGVVTAVGNGSATISATAGLIVGTGTVSVIQFVATVTVTPGVGSLVALGATQAFTAVAKDSSNAVVPGVRFLWGSSDPSIATVDTSGVATATGAGRSTISATGRGVPAYAELNVTQAAQQLAFSIGPASITAGEAFPTALQVEVRDQGGHLVPSARLPVTIALSVNPGGATLWGSTTVESVGGIATFAGLWLNRSGAGYKLTVTGGGLLAGTSSAFTVLAGPVATMSVSIYTSDQTEAGLAGSAPAWLDFADAYGNPVDEGFDQWDFSFNMRMPSGETFGVSGAEPALIAPGKLSIPGLRFPRAGTGATLEVSVDADGIPLSGHTSPFNVRTWFWGLSLADGHACGMTDGGAFCWGSNYGQALGTGIITASDSVPSMVVIGGPYTRVAAGPLSTCALTATGEARCWGIVPSGLVDGTGPGGIQFTEITVGSTFACGLTAGGEVYCWGDANIGQLGNGSDGPSATPVQVAGSGSGALIFTQIDAGTDHTCGLTTLNKVYCWGYNGDRQLGDGTQVASNVPVPTSSAGGAPTDFTRVVAGVRTTCGITIVGDIACWGSGPLGGGTSAVSFVPLIVLTANGGQPFTDVSVGNYHSCAVGEGELRCWGYNTTAQVGPGAVTNQFSPMNVNFGRTVYDVEASFDHTCAITDGGVYCWGGNAAGKLGLGTTDPYIVVTPTRIRQ